MLIYDASPFIVQNLMVSAQGFRLNRRRQGAEFRRRLRDYEARAGWSRDQLVAYREARRVEALARASRAPFYRDLFHRLGATWRDFVEPNAFRTLPIVTRADLAADIDAFRCRPPAPSDRIATTSGASGAALSLPVSREVEPDQWAVWWRYRRWHGLQPGDVCALFASCPVVPGVRDRRPYRLNHAGREIRCSIFHLSPAALPDYVAALNRHRPRWVHGNPSAVALFCRLLLDSGRTLDAGITHVTVGSENLQPWQAAVITQALGVAPRQHYGLAEAAANISEAPDGRLQIDEDFSYVELVPEDNGQTDGACAIVGTPFSNTALGLLRYHTGDLACAAPPAGPRDRRNSRTVTRLDGRLTDYVVLPDGRRIASLAVPFNAAEGLAAAQIHQRADGALTVRYVPGPAWRDDALEPLERRLRRRLGPDIPIRFEERREIDRTARGKVMLVVSDLTP